jgi:uncharacterized membrane protein YccF (DUF307 family)
MMTLHFHWLHAPRWLAHAHFNRALTLVLGIIGISLLFSALRVIDVAVSVARRGQAIAMAPAASGAPAPAERQIGADPADAGEAVDASLVEVPAAAAEAISL